ncbi:hypothetical protein FB451DRAFT_1097455 [Mycena latifolia]|nr:hypothetical protein FB451DRAFT_1097455 [Mycena latifolia]
MDSAVDSSIESPASLRTRLAALDQMGVLDATLAVERRRVLESLDSIRYPVLTLTPEITTQIFTYYAAKPQLGGVYPANNLGPLVLASVCRDWRAICLSVGALWASLWIYPSDDTRWGSETLLQLLRCWLPRAGPYPLEVHVFDSPWTGEIFRCLSYHTRNLQTLGVTLNHPFYFPTPHIRGRLPCLTKLVVNIVRHEREQPVLLYAFSDAPCLREVHLSGASLRWISLPWSQLTHMELENQLLLECVEILQETPNLEVLRVTLKGPPPPPLLPPSAPVGPVVLPSLHTLEFFHDPYGLLLTYLNVPALQMLALMSLASENSFRLLQTGLQSAWAPRSIRLTGMSPEAALLSLEFVPSLEAVEIQTTEWPYYDGAAWEPLIARLTQDDTFLPGLRALMLRGFPSTISALPLTEMLASRRNDTRPGVATLASFRLDLKNDEAGRVEAVPEMRTRLQTLASEGLAVVLG